MPGARINVSVQQKGAVFSASAVKANAARMVVNINEAIADEGVTRVKTRLGQVLKHPTGHYQSKIQVVKRSVYRGISDGGVIYGGWLEGVDSRNKTTRFKGYRTFRTIKQEMQREKGRIAEPIVRRLIKEVK